MSLPGPLVLGVRRILKNDAAAEDALQTTFLVLAKRASPIRLHSMFGNWLYSATRNAAVKAKAAIDKR